MKYQIDDELMRGLQHCLKSYSLGNASTYLADNMLQKLMISAVEVPDFSNGHMWNTMMAVANERGRQDAQWGGSAHDDTHSADDWVRFVEKQMYTPLRDGETRRDRWVKVAALAVAAVESIDRRSKA